MADIINLRTVRKQKARDDKDRLAAANRAKFGQTKAEKTLTEAEAQRADTALDGHQRDGEKP